MDPLVRDKTGDRIVVHPVTPDRWHDMEELAERPGPRGGTPILGSCWCMGWRARQLPGRTLRKQAMESLVAEDRQPGMLAYQGGRPVGWVSLALRQDHAALMRSRVLAPRDDQRDVYAIVCFYVDPTVRGTGVSSALLDAAIDHARRAGGLALEVYPKASLAPHAEESRRAEEAFSFMGRPDMYRRRGFVAKRVSGTHILMRLDFESQRRQR